MSDNPDSTAPEAVIPPAEPRVFAWLSRIEITIAAILLLTMFVGILWQVLGRYVPAANWPGAGEIARYSLMAVTFIMVGYLIGKNGQITVAVIDNVFKGRLGRMVVRYIAAILLTIICAVLLWEAWSLFQSGFGRTTSVLQIPLAWMFLFPLFGFASGTARAIVKIFTAHRPEQDALTFEEAEAGA